MPTNCTQITPIGEFANEFTCLDFAPCELCTTLNLSKKRAYDPVCVVDEVTHRSTTLQTRSELLIKFEPTTQPASLEQINPIAGLNSRAQQLAASLN